jgi:hypothetical protein
MSRALGAAFLSHQVEQLEKSVSAAPPRPPPSRNYNSNSNNWRDRQRPHSQPSADSKRGQLPIGGIRITTTNPHQQHQQKERPLAAKNRGAEDVKKTNIKEADVIVVDASVLVNALGQVKKWCRDGQEEIIIVPLEGTVSLSPLGHISPCRLHAVMLARMRYRGAHLAPAIRRQRYVTPPDCLGKVMALSPPQRGLEFRPIVPSNQRGVRSAIHSEPLPSASSAKHPRPTQEGFDAPRPACAHRLACARVTSGYEPSRTRAAGLCFCPLGQDCFR